MGSSSIGPRSLQLSIVDQTTYRSYIRAILIFPFSHSRRELAVQYLKKGLQATLTRWPYLAGTIGPADEDASRQSVKYSDRIPDIEQSGRFSTSYLESFPWSYTKLKEDGFPSSKLLVEDWVPEALYKRPGIESPIAERNLEKTKCPIPIFAIHAFFIDGGLILSFYCHHTIMDGAGISTFAMRFAENTRLQRAYDPPDPEDPSAARLAIDSRSHKTDPSLSLPVNPSESSNSNWVSQVLANNTKSQPIPPSTPRIFTFSRADLVAIRDELRAYYDGSEPPITVFQTLSALVWTHFTRCRRPRLDPNSKTQCAVAVNLRSRFREQVDEKFMGNASTLIAAELPVSHFLAEDVVTSQTLSLAANAIRIAIAGMTPEYNANLLARLENVKLPDDLFGFNYPQDVFITSWASFDFGGLVADWGIPGTGADGNERVVVRKPFSNADRSVLVYPRPMGIQANGLEAPYEVLIQMRGDDMERLLNEDGGLVSRAARVVE